MKLAGDYLFDAPLQEVWNALFDPEILAAVMPGCEKLELVDGRGAPGFVKATAAVELAPESAGTRIRYDADAQVGGKVASVGQRLLEASARAIIKQSLEGLHENIKIRAASHGAAGSPQVAAAATATSAPVAPGEAAHPAPPVALKHVKQSELAASIAKEVATTLVPRPVLIGIVVAVAALLVWLLLRH